MNRWSQLTLTRRAVLDVPTSSTQLAVDQHPCALLGRQPLFAVGFGHKASLYVAT